MSDIRVKVHSSGKEFDFFEDLFDNNKPASNEVKTGDTVELLTDVTIGNPVVITKKITLDLGGHYIFVPIPAALIVKNGVAVNIINGSIQTLSEELQEDAIIVQGSKTQLTIGPDVEINTRGTAIHVRKRGSLFIENALICATGSQPTIYVDDAYSTATLNMGKIASYEKSAIVVRNEGTFTINNGEIHTESNGLIPETTYPALLVNGKDSIVYMNGGTLFSLNTPAVKIEEAGRFEITDGEVYTSSDNYPAVEVHNNTSAFKMTNGWVYATKTSAILSNLMDFGDVQSIIMTDGKLGANGRIFQIAGAGDHGILVSGGRVKGFLDQDFIATGYVVAALPGEDGYYDIVLKTWAEANNSDSLLFPGVDDPDVKQYNPYEPVYDSDIVSREPLFPEDIIHGNPEHYEDKGKQPPLDPFAPPPVPPYDDIPVPVPPQPKPDPEPQPKPDPYRQINTSVNIRHKILIYKTPAKKFVATEWRGALTVVEIDHISPAGDNFGLVKFRVPASGVVSTGYALVDDLVREGGLVIP